MQISKTRAERMLGEITEYYEDASSAFRAKRALRTIENANFYRGNQYILRGNPENPDYADPRGEATEVINFTQAIVRGAVAIKLKQVPNPEVPAAHDDQRARSKADATERFARSIMRNGTIDLDEMHRCVSWAQQAGAGWMKAYWDPTAGRPVADTYETGFEGPDEEDGEEPAEMEPELDDFGNEVTRQVYEGGIRTEFVPTTDGLPDPAARSIREMHHFFHRKLRPVRELFDLFPKDMFGETTRGKWAIGTRTEEQTQFRQLYDDNADPMSALGSARLADGNVLAEIIEYWERPSRRFPNGRLMIFSDKLVLYVGPNPYLPARIPFVLFNGDNINAGSLYADGVVEQIKPLQRSANRTASKMREWLDKIVNAHILAPIGSGIDRNWWSDMPGQVIPYNKAFKPEFLNPPDIPTSLFGYLNEQIERSKFIAGYSDVARGEIPSDISGRAVAFATENEQTTREPDMQGHRSSVLKLMQECVHLARQFYEDGRLERMIGENGKWELVEFRSEDYDFENDLVPEIYSDVPTTRAARFSEAAEMMSAQMLGDTPEAKRARRLIGGRVAERLGDDEFERDRNRARREQVELVRMARDPMLMPAQLQVKSYDVDEIHLEEHNDFRKTPEYENLPTWLQMQFDEHCDVHELQKVAKLQAEGMFGQPGEPMQPQQLGPGVESPPSGGAPVNPGPPPSVSEFNQMDASTQASSDQQ